MCLDKLYTVIAIACSFQAYYAPLMHSIDFSSVEKLSALLSQVSEIIYDSAKTNSVKYSFTAPFDFSMD